MTKHECGSCRFFQEARGSKHGWCTHPDRRETTAVRILVRSAELRCRNDWGDDLWQERVESDRVLNVVMNEPGVKGQPDSSARPIPPPVEPRPIIHAAARVGDASAAADDRTSLVSTNLNRELLQRAHEQARERQRNRGYSVSSEPTADPPTSPQPEREPLVISNQYVPPSRQADAMPEALAPFEFADREVQGKFDVVPEASPVPPSDSRWQPEPAPDAEPASRLPVARAGRASAWRFEEDPGLALDTHAEHRGEPSPTRRHGRFTDDERPIARTRESVAPVRDRFERDPEEAQTQLYSFPDQHDDDYAVETWPEPAPASQARSVWAGIPKVCQTCRDFRPAGNGERGWCTNQWAFKHRRMVDAHDRPCETSIGNWWIPGDSAWQGALDISALGQPTPNVDKFLTPAAALDSGEMAPIRRRRQS